MKALITSDLHVDFKRTRNQYLNWNTEEDYDVLIVAGDIANRTIDTYAFMKELKESLNKPVLWVAGNHDFWEQHALYWPVAGDPIESAKHTIEQSQNIYSNVPGFMNRIIIEINGQRFLGCTLWYYVPGQKQDWSDHKNILDWWMIKEEAKADLEFLNQNLRQGDVVITHMLPTYDVVDPIHIGDAYNKFYVQEVKHLIERREPKLWISGHSHTRIVKTIGKTLYVRNPRGYPTENPNYSHVIVDLDKVGEYDAVWDCGWENSILTKKNKKDKTK